jgi:hypothetical protein
VSREKRDRGFESPSLRINKQNISQKLVFFFEQGIELCLQKRDTCENKMKYSDSCICLLMQGVLIGITAGNPVIFTYSPSTNQACY